MRFANLSLTANLVSSVHETHCEQPDMQPYDEKWMESLRQVDADGAAMVAVDLSDSSMNRQIAASLGK